MTSLGDFIILSGTLVFLLLFVALPFLLYFVVKKAVKKGIAEYFDSSEKNNQK